MSELSHGITRRLFTLGAATSIAIRSRAASAQGDAVRIGEINSYSRLPAFTLPYRKAMQMAVAEINDGGGIGSMGGRPLDIIFRDDGGSPIDAVRACEDLLTRQKVHFLAGTFLSNVALAVANYAARNKTMFLATEPLSDELTLAGGNRYTFRLRSNLHMLTGMLVDRVKDRGARRWAIVAPNYEYGTGAAEAFKIWLQRADPTASIVIEQYPALGRVDTPSTLSAIERAKPDGIFNALFGTDLVQLVRDGQLRGTFSNRIVASLITGEPEYLLPLGDETPEGWIVTGYPWDQVGWGWHKRFVAQYIRQFADTPRFGSFLGYLAAFVMRDILEAAGSTDTERLIEATAGRTFKTIAGNITIRDVDHQSTLGAWVGETKVASGNPGMINWRYVEGTSYMHAEDDVRRLRKSAQ